MQSALTLLTMDANGSAGAVATRSARGCTSHVDVSTRVRRQVEQATTVSNATCSGASHVHSSSVPPLRPALLAPATMATAALPTAR